MRRHSVSAVVCAAGAALSIGSAWAQTGLASDLIVSGFTRPVFVASPPGDTSRLFVVEQRGSAGVSTRADIKIINLATRTVNATPFFSTSSAGISVLTGTEQGLLGLAFDPNYATNRYFYIDYTPVGGGAGGQTIIARYRASSSDPNVTDYAAGGLTILSVPQPYANHKGGWLGFGPDGMLYASLGDGGLSGDPQGNAWSRGSRLGKILRLDVRNSSLASPYAIPANNPFVGVPGALPEVWAYGLRNPWRNSFDRETGQFYIADVGEAVWEEVNVAPAGVGGQNYGWRCFEGNDTFASTVGPLSGDGACPDAAGSGATFPVHAYTHDPECAITGGYVYRGAAIPWLRGSYFFSDYCAGWVRSFKYTGSANPAITDWTADLAPTGSTTLGLVVSFGEDARGELYMVDQGGGEIYRIVPQCPANCDGSTGSPALAAADFICFLSRVRSGDSFANCDGNTTPPLISAADFICFMNQFRAGCIGSQ